MVTGDPAPVEESGLGERSGRERNKLAVSLVNAIESRIFSGALKVGDRLPAEAEIARLYGVSTRSVREALQILETKGLLRRKHGERAMVVRDDVAEFMSSLAVTVKQLFAEKSEFLVQLMDVRRIIESEVVLRLSSGDFTVGGEVTAALDEMKAAADAGDSRRFTDADAKFHLGLVRSVGNGILNVLYDNLFSIIVDVIRVSSRVPDKSLEAGYAEHEEIHRLIVERDSEAAVAAIRRQIDNSANYLRVALDNAALSKQRKR